MKKTTMLIMGVIACCVISGCQSEEYKKAVSDYKTAAESVTQKNSELDSAITEAETVIAEGKMPLDKTAVPSLETAVSDAKAAKVEVMEMPKEETDINSVAKDLSSVDYSGVLTNLETKRADLERSIMQYELVTNPTEAYIIECLGNVSNIIDISAVTEETDVNGQLNKQGGYTAQIFFSSDLIDQNAIYGNTLIEKGTDAGGSIEVYTTPEDANKRNEYLTSFDGGVFSSGSHTVVGTVIVRTSNELTASQQKELETDIINSLTDVVN